MHTRTAIRNKYGIPGNNCTDCCVMAYCESCAFVQLQKEILARETAVRATRPTFQQRIGRTRHRGRTSDEAELTE
jgi:hypothetical protein